MSTTVLLGFLVTVMIAHSMPGPDFALILRHAARGKAYGRVAAFGVVSGHCVHLAFAALGLSALLARSATAFTVVKLAGAAYLLYLGITALWAARKKAVGAAADTSPESAQGSAEEPARTREPGGETPSPRDLRKAYLQGLLTNVLNPKAVVFFLSLLPQFIDQGSPIAPQVVVLGLITVTSGLAWWMFFVSAIDRVRGFLRRDRVRRIMDGVTGVVFIGLAVRLARTTAA